MMCLLGDGQRVTLTAGEGVWSEEARRAGHVAVKCRRRPAVWRGRETRREENQLGAGGLLSWRPTRQAE